MDIIWPPGVKSGQPHEMELGPEEDEIVILRRTDESCQYSLSYVTRPRELEDDELIEKAKQQAKRTKFGNEQAFYTVYSTVKTTVLHIENPDPDKAIHATFELDLDNLNLEGENQLNTAHSTRQLTLF